ncbi:50S ribosomal protein L3 N(5)-glutamine methyltransferase [Sulfuriferula thiophila]|uniref:50S ribosomal protein L3 N(5)-glutamine methyltransferase n=1 Tax=Sulfuriferula thiophila TaxID=1781211 RepID=UPI000F60FF7F|nr:50S ribosomal protein L3 N(5)-glutamine methyltransferase [Sulfuriferula thiophila]
MTTNYFLDTDALITVRDWLRFGISRMNQAQLHFGHGTTNALDEAAYLILHTLHLPIDNLEPFLDACLTEVEREDIREVFERRVNQRVPAAYITHEAWLGDLSFYVDERVLIPRSFIAQLLRERLVPWVADPECVTSALDMCTGSGCLAIMLAEAFPNADVDAVDLSPDALEVAERNVEEYGLNDQINLIQSDLFTQLGEQQYDVIITNPPYVNAPSMAELPPEYQAEPELALASGEDGLDHIRTILKHAAEHLYPKGILVAEIGHNRDELEAEFPHLPFTWLETDGSDEFVFILSKEQLNIR